MKGPHSDSEEERRLFEAVAHDVNNQLAAIAGYADQVDLALPDGHESHGDLERIHDAVEKVSALVALCGSTGNFVPRSADLAQVATLAARLLRKLCRVSVEIATDDVVSSRVHADPAALLEVLVLVERASRREGGAPPRLRSVFEPGTAGIRLEYPDSIDSSAVETPSRATEIAGEIGGRLVRDDHGWALFVPLANETRRAAGGGARFSHVLVVEPDGLLRSFLVSALDAKRVEEAFTGPMAEEVLRARGSELDLAILPLGLEGLDAEAAYRRLRNENEWTKVVLIGTEESASAELLASLRGDPHALFAAKPFTVKQVAKAIDGMTRNESDTMGGRRG